MCPLLLPGLEREVDLAGGGNAKDLKNAGTEGKFLEVPTGKPHYKNVRLQLQKIVRIRSRQSKLL